jgi:sRNA-binding protein
MAAEYKAAAQAKAEERAARNAARHAEKVQAKEDAAAAKKEAEEDIARKEREEANRCQADPECVRGVLRDNICGYRERVQEILKNIATEKRGARRVGVINLGALQAWKEELVYEEDNLKGAMAEWKGYTHKAFKGSCK